MSQKIAVLGAGIVGISCALELQIRGCQVRLIDRRGPGEETSSGNAGILSYSNITPLASPELLSRVHRLLLNRDADLLIHYPHLLALLPWLIRFALRCRRKTFISDGRAMSALSLPSIELHRQWIKQANAEQLLNPAGGLKLYRSQRSFIQDRLERELLDICAIKYNLLEREQIRDYEPDLSDIFVKAVLIDDSMSLRNPEKLCQAYAELFARAGGEICRGEIKSLSQLGGSWQLIGEPTVLQAEKLVVCLGAWTPGILGTLGYANPIAIERGYHTMLSAQAGHKLSRPIFDVDASYVMAPMESGLRLSTGSNLTYRETAPNAAQLERVLPRAREAFPLDRELLHTPWMGRRPTLPDSLPIIGPAPAHDNLWLAFAHSHMGLTMGPMTGRLIANFILGEPQPLDVKPYAAQRYL